MNRIPNMHVHSLVSFERSLDGMMPMMPFYSHFIVSPSFFSPFFLHILYWYIYVIITNNKMEDVVPFLCIMLQVSPCNQPIQRVNSYSLLPSIDGIRLVMPHIYTGSTLYQSDIIHKVSSTVGRVTEVHKQACRRLAVIARRVRLGWPPPRGPSPAGVRRDPRREIPRCGRDPTVHPSGGKTGASPRPLPRPARGSGAPRRVASVRPSRWGGKRSGDE